MTPAAILADLPNGFHDATIRELHVEFAREQVTLEVEFWVGDLDAETEEVREATRVGQLLLTGVTSMFVEPPDPRYQFSMGDGIDVDGGFGPYPGDPAPPDDGLVRLWFFVSTWNARMTFTVSECVLEWR